MDIKKRLRNKTFVVTMVTVVLAFTYQILGMFGVVPSVGQDKVTSIAMLVVNLLAGLGILVDPTTGGVSDGE